MSQDEFTRLFKYMEMRFDKIDALFEENKQEHIQIRAAIVELGGHLKDYHQELLLLAHKVDRLERWIQQVAQQTGVKLEY